MTATPVDEYLRHLVVERGLAQNTISSYRRDLVIYADWLAFRGIAGPSAATEQDLGDFVRFLGADRVPPLATSSIARVLSAVRGLHRFHADEGLVAADVSRSNIAKTEEGENATINNSVFSVNVGYKF